MNHSETITIECTINGMPFQLHAAPGMPLSELLREQGLLSVKQGCCVGECGACTVLVDGTAIDSCLFLAAWAEGKEIRTLEGEAKQENFLMFNWLMRNPAQCNAGFVRRA